MKLRFVLRICIVFLVFHTHGSVILKEKNRSYKRWKVCLLIKFLWIITCHYALVIVYETCSTIFKLSLMERFIKSVENLPALFYCHNIQNIFQVSVFVVATHKTLLLHDTLFTTKQLFINLELFLSVWLHSFHKR